MRLKLWGLVLLALAGAMGIVCVFYRQYAHIPACEEEYRYRLSRSGRLPGSRRKKDSSVGNAADSSFGADTDGFAETSAESGRPSPWENAPTAVMTADIPAESLYEPRYAPTEVMEE